MRRPTANRTSWATGAERHPTSGRARRGHPYTGGRGAGDTPVTRWGMLLLAAYIALAMSRLDERTAVRTAVTITAAVFVVVGLRRGVL
jgi:hypothetical protein